MQVTLEFIIFVLIFVGAFADPWDSSNNPTAFDDNSVYSYKLSSLASFGTLTKIPWSDTYWPSYQSGIARRWNAPEPQDFSYSFYTKEELLNMTQQQLMTLSPAEKYDLYLGDYKFPLVQSEWRRTSPDDATWEGLCHGWAVAAMVYGEPHPIIVTNPDNITVPFGSSDIKALLTYWDAVYQTNTDTQFMGQRCNFDLNADPSKLDFPACADLNAGSQFVLMANLISKDIGYVIDRDRSIQVWNQPVYGYDGSIVENRTATNTSAPGTVREVRIQMTLYWVRELVPSWVAQPPYILTFALDFWLELSDNETILGGSWNSYNRPDFAWNMVPSDFADYFAPLSLLYYQSTGTQAPTKPSSALETKITPVVLTTNHGTISHFNYANNEVKKWSIAAPAGTRRILIEFEAFSTEKYRDVLKIYKGKNGNGVIVAVFHGDQIPEPVIVDGDGALIVFQSDPQEEGKGFQLKYTF